MRSNVFHQQSARHRGDSMISTYSRNPRLSPAINSAIYLHHPSIISVTYPVCSLSYDMQWELFIVYKYSLMKGYICHVNVAKQAATHIRHFLLCRSPDRLRRSNNNGPNRGEDHDTLPRGKLVIYQRHATTECNFPAYKTVGDQSKEVICRETENRRCGM